MLGDRRRHPRQFVHALADQLLRHVVACLSRFDHQRGKASDLTLGDALRVQAIMNISHLLQTQPLLHLSLIHI